MIICGYCGGRTKRDSLGRRVHATTAQRIPTSMLTPGDMASAGHNRQGTIIGSYDLVSVADPRDRWFNGYRGDTLTLMASGNHGATATAPARGRERQWYAITIAPSTWPVTGDASQPAPVFFREPVSA